LAPNRQSEQRLQATAGLGVVGFQFDAADRRVVRAAGAQESEHRQQDMGGVVVPAFAQSAIDPKAPAKRVSAGLQLEHKSVGVIGHRPLQTGDRLACGRRRGGIAGHRPEIDRRHPLADGDAEGLVAEQPRRVLEDRHELRHGDEERREAISS
jgi:hypothetical protein